MRSPCIYRMTHHSGGGTGDTSGTIERQKRRIRSHQAGTAAAGYVQIETEEGIVDASVFVQLENLKRQLAELLK